MAENWVTVTESQFPWERDALDYVRSLFPSHEPYRAWSNFEFVASDGSIYEVDLLVFTPVGFFLIEIKSSPGRLFGDAGTWTWDREGRLFSTDNPVYLANTKAKKLKSLLQQQRAAKKQQNVPYMDVLVFCSDPDLRCDLDGTARHHVCLRDRKPEGDDKGRKGIIAAIKHRDCAGIQSSAYGDFNKPTSKMVAQALKQAGIRKSQRHLKVGDYQLKQVIGEGPGYQDWSAQHTQLEKSWRRTRIYNLRSNSPPEERQTRERSAKREAELLEGLQHPGVLRLEGFTAHELGPALIFEYDPHAVRLDHYILQKTASDSFDAEARCLLLREIAETVRFAHDRRTYHRGLSPQSILVNDANPLSRIKIFNWQSGFRGVENESRQSLMVSATSHLDRVVDDASTAYIAPEALNNTEEPGEKQDLFSLGAVAYFLFTGKPPAENGLQLSERLRDSSGLQISAVMSAGENLQELIQWTTSPIVSDRIDTAAEFIDLLDLVEKELRTSELSIVENPLEAKSDDVLQGGLTVIKRIGSGASSIAFLVHRDGEPLILKVANDPDYNDRLREEGETLSNFHHQSIAEHVETVTLGGHVALLIRPAMSNVEKLKIETLRHRLKQDGALHIDLLQRFGHDLLNALEVLEDQSVYHRDIKPDNIAVGQVRKGEKLRLVLFDFSLSKASVENMGAGTPGYLDPMLPLRKRYDSYADRYAAAVTLYQMATGHKNFPQWGTDGTDPTHIDCVGEIDPELFDASLRDDLTEFFEKAFNREIKRRHDNAFTMRTHWSDCFRHIEEAGSHSDHVDGKAFQELLDKATLETAVSDLGLGTRAVRALERIEIANVQQMLAESLANI